MELPPWIHESLTQGYGQPAERCGAAEELRWTAPTRLFWRPMEILVQHWTVP